MSKAAKKNPFVSYNPEWVSCAECGGIYDRKGKFADQIRSTACVCGGIHLACGACRALKLWPTHVFNPCPLVARMFEALEA
jgi:hypothetical protein